jgi:hypothetical protein
MPQVKWDRFNMITRPAVNVHLTMSIMHVLLVAALHNLVADATAQVSGSGGDIRAIDCPLLQPAHVLAAQFGFKVETLVQAICETTQCRLQFGLHYELAPAEVAESDKWTILRSLIDAATIPCMRPEPTSSQHGDLRALATACEKLCVRSAAIPAALSGAASLVGRFATAWHAQNYSDLLPQFYPDRENTAGNPATASKTGTGHLLLLMLARLGFTLDERLRVRRPSQSSMPAEVSSLFERLRRRVWCWYFAVKWSLESKSTPPVELFPSFPELPAQAQAASALWELLWDEETASHRVATEAGLTVRGVQ